MSRREVGKNAPTNSERTVQVVQDIAELLCNLGRSTDVRTLDKLIALITSDLFAKHLSKWRSRASKKYQRSCKANLTR